VTKGRQVTIAMGQKCCSERKGATGDGLDRRNSADAKKRAVAILYHSKGVDADQFDKAFETNDLKAFVELLQSNQVIQSCKQQMHPWAADPQTIGALAATQLAILASVAAKDDVPSESSLKLRIHEAGAVIPLVNFLRSDQEDRVQTAVVALSFLTADCPQIAIAAYESGAMELLLQHFDSKVAGMRAAAATTLRNICVEKDDYRAHFAKLGGITRLVGQLSAPPDPALNTADVQLEAVLNLQDVIETQDGILINEYALEAIKAGAEAKLKHLTQAQDDEVRLSAEELLACFGTLKTRANTGF